ncbi:cysteine desulfurase mitochondrial-like [Senna tora]|uniref:Cysteine desulfurase mitochondrial-like n=1 Tax=Senna tora TaxID=362788 RepID=A0A834X8B8_9FABA|nr:cysteine desulfurase mitochondrial-like [Senna tora]
MATGERDDDVLVVYEEDEVLKGIENRVFTLAGKWISTKPANKGALENAFRNIWNQPQGFRVEEMNHNLFLFHFTYEKDMERVLDAGSWIFRNKWLIMARWKRGMDGTEEAFSMVNIWMQIWGAPLQCRTEKVARKLCAVMGDVQEVGLFEDQTQGTIFIKGLVSFNLKNALRKGTNLGNSNDGVFWVDFRYEKIPRCCFSCGVFGHDESECETKKKVEDMGKVFLPKELGSWIKAVYGGKKIAWPGEARAKQGDSMGEERKMGLVKKNETELLMEKLARMTVEENAKKKQSKMVVEAVNEVGREEKEEGNTNMIIEVEGGPMMVGDVQGIADKKEINKDETLGGKIGENRMDKGVKALKGGEYGGRKRD